MICAMVEKMQRKLVHWDARCEFETRQNLACEQILTQVPILALCYFCHMKA